MGSKQRICDVRVFIPHVAFDDTVSSDCEGTNNVAKPEKAMPLGAEALSSEGTVMQDVACVLIFASS
jgi:hypothetical protein